MSIPGLTFNNPLDPETIDTVIEQMALGPDDVVLDVGCGRGEMLARLVERYGCRGIGAEPRAGEIAAARERTVKIASRMTLHERRIEDVDLAPGSFAAALCVGATQAFGGPGAGYRAALGALRALVRPAGLIVIGEGYWRREPAEAYLAATGMGAGDLDTHAGNVEVAAGEGLRPLFAAGSSRAAWDRFESRFWWHAENDLARDPEDPDALARAEHWRGWRQAYLRWGRETLGFGLYVYSNGG